MSEHTLLPEFQKRRFLRQAGLLRVIPPPYSVHILGFAGSLRQDSYNRALLRAMLQPELLVFRAHEKFDAQGSLTDEPTRQFLAKFLGALAEWTTRFKTAPG